MSVTQFFNSLLAILNEMSPYILLGFIIAGILHVFIRPEAMSRHLAGRGWGPVVRAALYGIPLPLCSCGVLPTAVSLRRRGSLERCHDLVSDSDSADRCRLHCSDIFSSGSSIRDTASRGSARRSGCRRPCGRRRHQRRSRLRQLQRRRHRYCDTALISGKSPRSTALRPCRHGRQRWQMACHRPYSGRDNNSFRP